MLRTLRQFLVVGDDVVQQGFADLIVVVALLKADAKNIALLDRLGDVVRVDLDDVVAALALGFQDLERLVRVARGDDAVRHLVREVACGVRVAHVGERRPVAVGAQAIRTARADVGARDRGQLVVSLDEVHLLFDIGQRFAERRARGGHMLKGRRGRHAGRLFERLHQLPRVKCVAEVDIARLTVQNLDRQLALGHKNARRLLVGVAAVFECEFFHASLPSPCLLRISCQ